MRSIIKNNIKNSGLILVVAFALLSVAGGTAVAGKLITGKSVQNSSLTGADIKRSSLTGSDLKNGTVGPSDLSDSAKTTLVGPTGPTGATGAPGSHAPMATSYSGSLNTALSTSFDTIAGGSVSIDSPAGTTKLLATFSAECSVVDPAAYRTHYVRFLVDGVVTGATGTLCSNTIDFDQQLWTGASIQRVFDVAPGPHTVEVQHAVSNGAATGYLDDKTLSVITG
ncbi:MAG: hypothetical protein WAP35_01900 [Solirubrobacterales bacterium]